MFIALLGYMTFLRFLLCLSLFISEICFASEEFNTVNHWPNSIEQPVFFITHADHEGFSGSSSSQDLEQKFADLIQVLRKKGFFVVGLIAGQYGSYPHDSKEILKWPRGSHLISGNKLDVAVRTQFGHLIDPSHNKERPLVRLGTGSKTFVLAGSEFTTCLNKTLKDIVRQKFSDPQRPGKISIHLPMEMIAASLDNPISGKSSYFTLAEIKDQRIPIYQKMWNQEKKWDIFVREPYFKAEYISYQTSRTRVTGPYLFDFGGQGYSANFIERNGIRLPDQLQKWEIENLRPNLSLRLFIDGRESFSVNKGNQVVEIFLWSNVNDSRFATDDK